jgi:hypothetical protein
VRAAGSRTRRRSASPRLLPWLASSLFPVQPSLALLFHGPWFHASSSMDSAHAAPSVHRPQRSGSDRTSCLPTPRTMDAAHPPAGGSRAGQQRMQDRAEQHSTNHALHGLGLPPPHRIASGVVQKAPAASQWTLLTFLQLHLRAV